MTWDILLALSGEVIAGGIARDIRDFLAPLAAVIIGVIGLKYLFGDQRSIAGFVGFLFLGVVVYSLIKWGDAILGSLGGLFRGWVEDGNALPLLAAILIGVAALAFAVVFGIVLDRAPDQEAEGGVSVTPADEPPAEAGSPSRDGCTRAAWAVLPDCAPKHADPGDVGRWRNQIRLAVVVAVERGVFDAGSPVTPAHLAKWVVLRDLWPDVVDRLWTDVDLLRVLEESPHAVDEDDEALVRFLSTGPPLHPVVRNLLHMVPSVDPG
ncbi:hypothetical protein B0I31_10130 [Saccharothrix carnea]|uniref:Uncharacterized protein n=1 Tax=Saccharothrix carnea TaxID=1280637 RepID=A0A2P8IH80_SACCR|nr:hypothetical protein [Saccharothrix carnea]PSL57819.1 hypothetical protein B0I31_10130 [Saccharothrix carnea]